MKSFVRDLLAGLAESRRRHRERRVREQVRYVVRDGQRLVVNCSPRTVLLTPPEALGLPLGSVVELGPGEVFRLPTESPPAPAEPLDLDALKALLGSPDAGAGAVRFTSEGGWHPKAN